MKRVLAMSLVLAIFSLVLPLSAALADSTAVVVGGWLRLRNAPSDSAGTIASYPSGTVVTVFSTSNGWCSVQAPDGRNGYMRAAYLSSTSGSSGSGGGSSSFTAYVSSPNGLGVALRTGAGTNYGIIAYYNVGTAVTVLSVGSIWDRVQIGSVTGYMMAQYLSGTKPATPVTPVVPTTYTGYVTSRNGRGVNLRTGAGTAYGIIGTYPVGTQVKILSSGSVWDYIQIGNIKGYMMAQYITTSAPVSPVTPVTPVSPVVPTKGTAYVTSTNGKPVRLRSGPGTHYGILGAYPVGTAVQVINAGPVWSSIVIGNTSGYMMTAFLTEGSYTPTPTAAPDPFIVYNGYVYSGNGGNVLLRLNPSTTASVLDSYAIGTELTVLRVQGNWAYVSIGGRTGWMMLQFITTVKPEPATNKITSVTLSTYTPQVGQIITATTSPAGSTAQYIWHYENGSIVCYNASYSITKIDIGHKLYCTVLGTGKWSGEMNSGMTAAVVDYTGPLALTGGITLPTDIYANTTISFNDLAVNTLPTSDLSYNWQINGVTVSSGFSLYVQPSYVGNDLRLIVTANSTSGYTGSVGSNYVIVKPAISSKSTTEVTIIPPVTTAELIVPDTLPILSAEDLVPEVQPTEAPLVELITPDTVPVLDAPQAVTKLSGSVHIPAAAVPGTGITADLSGLPTQNVTLSWYSNGSLIGHGSSVSVPNGMNDIQVVATANAQSGYTGSVSSNVCVIQSMQAGF